MGSVDATLPTLIPPPCAQLAFPGFLVTVVLFLVLYLLARCERVSGLSHLARFSSGPSCAGVCDCGSGVCADGLSGDGRCTCSAGFDPNQRCDVCLRDHYGPSCTVCPGKGLVVVLVVCVCVLL